MSTSTIASDLQALREARGLSVEQLQQRTRVPTDIIRRLEGGTLLDDSKYSDVYLQAFLKSYAEAVDIPSGAVVSAIAEAKHGQYTGSLRQYLPDGAKRSQPRAAAAPTKEKPEPTAAPAGPRPSGEPAAAAALAQQPKESPQKASAPATAARAPSRNARGSRTSKSIDKSWGGILGIAGAALAIIALVLFFLFRGDPEEQQALQPVLPDTTQVAAVPEPDEAEPTPTARVDAPALQLPLQVTLLAQQPLAGFRVTEAPDIRRPYWLEAGASQTFESAEEIVLWGGERADGYGLMEGVRFRMQGLEWTPQNGVVRITPANGQALLDSVANLPRRPAGQ